jgi:hypothetical protein
VAVLTGLLLRCGVAVVYLASFATEGRAVEGLPAVALGHKISFL